MMRAGVLHGYDGAAISTNSNLYWAQFDCQAATDMPLDLQVTRHTWCWQRQQCINEDKGRIIERRLRYLYEHGLLKKVSNTVIEFRGFNHDRLTKSPPTKHLHMSRDITARVASRAISLFTCTEISWLSACMLQIYMLYRFTTCYRFTCVNR